MNARTIASWAKQHRNFTVGLTLYNTMTRRKEAFEPLHPGKVGIYVCGPTVYNYLHIGNGRMSVVFDTLRRVMERTYDVTFVCNVTDIEDKIIKESLETGVPAEELTSKFIDIYHEDVAALGVREPDIEPRATDHVPQMVAFIERLIKSGHAYETAGNGGTVLFDVSSDKDYGSLSHRELEDMLAGARVEVADYKRAPADFILWKPAEDGEPGWDSPWGRGRPGWHLECSVMSEEHLGDTFDIHGGGNDLVFPHHENELAQSRCAHAGAPFANYWVHNGMLDVEGDKMSKSLGNFVTIRQLLEAGHDGEVLRYALLSAHYRQPLNWSQEGLEQARQNVDRFYTALRRLQDIEAIPDEVRSSLIIEALEDDLNTPKAMGVMHALATEANKALDKEEQGRIKGAIEEGAALLGILTKSPEDWFQRAVRVGGVPSASTGITSVSSSNADLLGPSEERILEQIVARETARADKDFAKADRIRDELDKAGILLEDGANGTTWKRKR